MCGIAGFVRFRGEAAGAAAEVAAMTRRLAHRGPDDEGFGLWSPGGAVRAYAGAGSVPEARAARPDIDGAAGESARVALGHRRFSIIDPTASGHQPFLSPDGRLALVFNGEIYNYLELRRELEAQGVAFRTHSDTEVLLHACRTWGDEAVRRLNGMWAFALLDTRTGRVLLSRDRIGERPLFYVRTAEGVWFASEIKALFALPGVWARRKADDDRLLAYLYLGLRDHRPGSFFEGIAQLPPAAVASVGVDGSWAERTFWSLPRDRRPESDLSFDEARNGLAERLRRSVELRLRADVPLAAELSGGIDSSSIAWSAAELRAARGVTQPFHAVTVKYPEKEFDESAFAQATARRFGLDLHTIELTAGDYWAVAEEMLRIQEQPYESPNLLGSRAIWTWAKAGGYRVILNGGGGDELLAGYTGQYVMPFLRDLFRAGRWGDLARELTLFRRHGVLSPTTARHFLASRLVCGPLRGAYHARLLNHRTFRHLRPVRGGAREGLIGLIDRQRRGGLAEALARSMEFSPMPMYMVHGDKLCMSVPVEVRYPYLDPDLIEYCFRLPTAYLMRDGYGKYLSRRLVADHVPAEVAWRRQKMGFPVPLAAWMEPARSRLRDKARSGLRLGRLVDPAVLANHIGSAPAPVVWWVHQAELWMELFDLS